MASEYKFEVDDSLIGPNQNIAFDIDFTSPKTAADTARNMIIDKCDYRMVDGKIGEDREEAILDFVRQEIVDNLVGPVVDNALIRYDEIPPSTFSKVQWKSWVFQRAAELNPSVGAILAAYKKVFGEITATESLYQNYDQLSASHIAEIERINRAVSDINREQSRDEQDRLSPGSVKVPITDLSKRDRDAWNRSYDSKRSSVIGNYMPYLILDLNYTHIPQKYRNNEAKKVGELMQSEEFNLKPQQEKVEQVRKVRRSVLIEFKNDELNKYFANTQFYTLPLKRMA